MGTDHIRRPCILNFAEEMEKKLETRDDELGEKGWWSKDTTVQFLIDRLNEEVHELIIAALNYNPYEIMNECVDVANFAMMVHDRLNVMMSKHPGYTEYGIGHRIKGGGENKNG